MIYPSADKLESWGSKYALVTLAAKRAKQIKSGAPPFIDTDSRNPLTIALEEIALGKICCDVAEVDAISVETFEPEVAQLLAIPEETDEEAATLTDESVDVSKDEIAEDVYEEDEEEEIEEEAPVSWIDEEIEKEIKEEAPTDDEEEDEAISSIDLVPDIDEIDSSSENEAVKPKRGRGRPKKTTTEDIDSDMDIDSPDSDTGESDEEDI